MAGRLFGPAWCDAVARLLAMDGRRLRRMRAAAAESRDYPGARDVFSALVKRLGQDVHAGKALLRRRKPMTKRNWDAGRARGKAFEEAAPKDRGSSGGLHKSRPAAPVRRFSKAEIAEFERDRREKGG